MRSITLARFFAKRALLGISNKKLKRNHSLLYNKNNSFYNNKKILFFVICHLIHCILWYKK